MEAVTWGAARDHVTSLAGCPRPTVSATTAWPVRRAVKVKVRRCQLV